MECEATSEEKILINDANSVHSDKLQEKTKKTRRKRKRNHGNETIHDERLSLNLESSLHSLDSQTQSSSDSIGFRLPSSRDESSIMLKKLRNFEVKNKIYPTILSSTLQYARFFVIKSQTEDDIHKVILFY